jgi:hypothetical protein
MNFRFLSLGLIALVATACKPPPELTDDSTGEGLSLSEAIPLFFRDFDEDAAKLPDYIDALEAGLADQGVDLASTNLDDRSFSIDPLTSDFLGGAVQPPDTDPAEQTSVVAFGLSNKDFAANQTAALEPNQVCIESDSTVSYTRTYSTDVAAFEAGTTDVARSTNVIRKELSFIASGWYELYKDFRSFETNDGRKVLVARAWSDKVAKADGGKNEFRQSFTAELYIEDGTTTKRMYAIWPEISIGLGPDAMRSLITDSLDEGYQNAEAFMADSSVPDCKNDRSAVFTRE